MKKLAVALLISLLGTNLTLSSVYETISIGVKKGDWIEYQAIFTGTPPEGHEVTWARLEVVDVQGKVISLNISTKFVAGTLLNESITLNLGTGQLGDDFIIPANLDAGDTFEDNYHGIMKISAVEEKTYAGTTRIVVTATVAGSTYYWDRTTGILVEGITQFSDYSIRSIADKTNMWKPETSAQDSAIQYAILAVALAVSTALVTTILLRRRK